MVSHTHNRYKHLKYTYRLCCQTWLWYSITNDVVIGLQYWGGQNRIEEKRMVIQRAKEGCRNDLFIILYFINMILNGNEYFIVKLLTNLFWYSYDFKQNAYQKSAFLIFSKKKNRLDFIETAANNHIIYLKYKMRYFSF